jgi:hypothetical protein
MVLQLEMSKNTAHVVTKLLQLQLYKMAVVRTDYKAGMLV